MYNIQTTTCKNCLFSFNNLKACIAFYLIENLKDVQFDQYLMFFPFRLPTRLLCAQNIEESSCRPTMRKT